TRRVGDFDTADGPGEAACARSDPTSGGAPCSDAGPAGAAVGKPQGPAAGSKPQQAPGGGGEPPGAAADGGGLEPQRIAEPRGPAVRSDTSVERVLLENGRAIGVELAGGERIAAGEVVLCAGAVGTPRILLRSGLGPADTLRTAGIDVQLDLPDVGRGWSDHPAVFLPFRTDDPPPHPHAPTAQAALHWDAGADPAGDVEVLLFTRPFVPGGDLHLMCALQQPDSRGVLDLNRISYGYLRTEHDRRRLRHA